MNLLCQTCGHGYSQPGPPEGVAVVADGLDPYLFEPGLTVFHAVSNTPITIANLP